MLPESKYLVFLLQFTTGKTEIVEIQAKGSFIPLGKIKWFGRWRQYCFFPEAETVFSPGCMIDIINCIEALRIRRLEKGLERNQT